MYLVLELTNQRRSYCPDGSEHAAHSVPIYSETGPHTARAEAKRVKAIDFWSVEA